MKSCDWCDQSFETKISYQIYCSVECREESTKDKIAQRYAITRRSRMIGRKRNCKSCGLGLSAYNDQNLCSNCVIDPKDVSRALRELKGIVNDKDKFSD